MSILRPRNSLEAWLYRALMRVAHRFDWHYAPIIGPMMGDPGDWRNQLARE